MFFLDPLFLAGACGSILFGIATLVASRLVATPGQPASQDPLRLTMIIVGWLLIAVGLAGLVFFAVGIFIGIVALIVLVMAFQKHKTAQRYALLSTLAVAARRQMPLAPAIEAFADENWGSLAHGARRLAALLKAGCPLPEAMLQSGRLVPRDALATIRVGYESGSLSAALEEVADSYRVHESLWGQMSGKVLYFCVVLLFMAAVSMFMALKITPAFQKIFADFEMQLPRMTQAVLNADRLVLGSGLWLLLLAPLLLLFVLFIQALLHYTGLPRWDLPGCGPLVRRFHTASILEALAMTADRGLPFQDAVATMARWHPKRAVRVRLLGALADMEAGGDWAESLAGRDLIKRADLAVLKSAQRVGNLPWALREMAASSRRRLAYRLQGLLQVLFVLVVIAFGLMVGTFVVSYFLPLIRLIESLS